MYTEKVKFTDTNQYGYGPDNEDVYTVEEFKYCVGVGAFIDYDGFGYPVKDKMSDPSITIKPSEINRIPLEATHIIWFNR